MKFSYCIFVQIFLFTVLHISSFGQELIGKPKNSLKFSLGVGYDDGLTLLRTVPALGFGYERMLNKRFSVASHIFSFYRTMPDSYFDRDLNGRFLIDLKARGASQPFFSPEEEALITRGVIPLDSRNTVKKLSLPVDIGIIYYPINSKRHSLGVNFALCMTYTSHNWWRDYYSIFSLVLEDGTEATPLSNDLMLSLNSEFHSFTPQLSLKLIYEYKFKNFGTGFRISNYGYVDMGLDFFSRTLTIWDTSLFLTLKL